LRKYRVATARGKNHGADLQTQFAILCDGTAFEGWQLDCLDKLFAVESARGVLLIHRFALTASTALTPEPTASPALTPAHLADRLAALRAVALADVGARATPLDFILSLTSDPCPTELLEAARYGVWAFQFGDWLHYRGGPAGFWEVYDGECVTAALLVRLQRSADEVVVLREGYLRTNQFSARRNREQLLERITRWPAQMCRDLGNGVVGRLTAEPLRTRVPARGAPTRAQRLAYRCRVAARMARVGLRSLFRHDQWNVGRIDRPIGAFLNSNLPLAPITWLPAANRAEFKADPFGVLRDGRLTILYEHFSYRTNRGIIAAVEAAGGAVSTPVEIGPTPAVHLSYPYLIEVDGRLRCIPESHEAGEVALYDIEHFPDRWVKVGALLENIRIVDASLFRHEGTWWLAGSEPTAKGTSCELSLWHAAAITGPWYPHAANPVKTDVRSARPGGTPFYENGVLYRPAQDCSKTYGGRVIINRVVTLTPTAFHEVEAARVEPDPRGEYPAGLHTLSQVGEITLIDGKRVIFSPAEFRRVLLHYLQSIRKRLRR
jgi:hypothetical protein